VTRLALLLTAALALAGCQPNASPDTYQIGGIGQVNRVVRGKVVSVRQIEIAGTHGVGVLAGAGAGAAGGAFIGNNAKTNIIGAIGGAVVGGLIGAAVEESATKQKGWEYIVETENGALITIVQGGDTPLAAGQRVFVEYGAQSRVIPDSSAAQ
jgi:outer membrane lipoprotein SlyB